MARRADAYPRLWPTKVWLGQNSLKADGRSSPGAGGRSQNTHLVQSCSSAPRHSGCWTLRRGRPAATAGVCTLLSKRKHRKQIVQSSLASESDPGEASRVRVQVYLITW
ncbi:hypothetical protein BDA96_04G179800 [Sorghum bicolor]|uniref:Uncharacterized protein n=1 Tax=Sorghum bicolor TaxID=4558 RepID=A0A921R584_SORBI|nr:hypothetical protein BDA96_04G179800 [Sorghum bicolor]